MELKPIPTPSPLYMQIRAVYSNAIPTTLPASLVAAIGQHLQAYGFTVESINFQTHFCRECMADESGTCGYCALIEEVSRDEVFEDHEQ